MLRRRINEEFHHLDASNQQQHDDVVSHRSKRNNMMLCCTKLRKFKIVCGLVSLILSSFILLNSKKAWLHDNTPARSRRFPRFGTHEFAQQCNWTLTQQQESDCTLLLRMEPGGSEGIAQWISEAVTGFLLAKQTSCHFYMDYGDGVDVHQVLTTTPLASSSSSMNWTIPYDGFQCLRSNHCVNVTPNTATQFAENKSLLTLARYLGRNNNDNKVARVPFYRHAYVHTLIKYPKIYQDLEEKLVGFRLETGMACSLGSLLDLTPSASKFEPDLFTRILPTLRDEQNLVMAIYIRSGQTDKAFQAEKEGTTAKEKMEQYQGAAMPCLECALQIEETYLSEAGSSSSYYSKVVWMLVTDSTYLKQLISDSYRLPPPSTKETKKSTHTSRTSQVNIPREIVTTKSRGVQTRTSRNPSTADFAEALIDWYLIGESDVVVTNSRQHSYGGTAALRTARPFYEPSNCSEPLDFDNVGQRKFMR